MMPADKLSCGDCGGEFGDVDELLEHDCDGRDDDPEGGVGGRVLVADGGPKYTPMQEFTASISGKLCLDARAVGDQYAEVNATPAALEDNAERLEAEGYNTEVYLDDEPPRMVVHPRPGDLDFIATDERTKYRELRDHLSRSIDRLADQHDDPGARTGTVIDYALTKTRFDIGEIGTALEQLQNHGEVYRPAARTVALVDAPESWADEQEPATDGGIDLAEWYALHGFKRDLLRALLAVEAESGLASYGLAIKRELEARYSTEVNHGRLYPNLDDLVQDGLVEKAELDKRTNEYTLSACGRALLEAALLEDYEHLELPSTAASVPAARTDGGQQGGENDGGQ